MSMRISDSVSRPRKLAAITAGMMPLSEPESLVLIKLDASASCRRARKTLRSFSSEPWICVSSNISNGSDRYAALTAMVKCLLSSNDNCYLDTRRFNTVEDEPYLDISHLIVECREFVTPVSTGTQLGLRPTVSYIGDCHLKLADMLGVIYIGLDPELSGMTSPESQMTVLQTHLFKSVATIVVARDFLDCKELEDLEKSFGNQNITVLYRDPEDFKPRSDGELCKTIQADHLLSDAVCFVGKNFSEIIDPYLDWISACGGDFAVERNRPFAYAWAAHDYNNRQQARDDFLYECLENQKASNMNRLELVNDAFQDLEILDPSKPGELGIALRRAANIGRLQREAVGKLWSAADFISIRARLIGRTNQETLSPFSIAAAVTEPWTCHDGGKSFHRVLFDEDGLKSPTNDPIILIASYLCHHARQSRHWTYRPERLRRVADKKIHFAETHFDCRYKETIEFMIRSTIPTMVDKDIDMITSKLRRSFRSILTSASADSPFSSHVVRVRSYETLLRGKDFGYSCATCLINQWDSLLPCGQHGMCHSCLQQCEGYCYNTCTVSIRKCHVCDCRFDEWKAQVIPPSARGSILALDGGGVRGLIQLEILSCIENEIGLGLPLMRFFDLIVGSSIGLSKSATLSLTLLIVSQVAS